MKSAALIVLFVLACVLVYYFLFYQNQNSFVPGTPINVNQFAQAFGTASNINIFMDVRGIKNSNTTENILQCGVDFAASNGMGSKNVTYFSAADDGCTSVDGKHTMDYCFSAIKNGLTIYITAGNSSSYYSNGLVVGVGPTYKLGTCGIRVVG